MFRALFRRSRIRRLVVVAVYVGLALATTWPVARAPLSSLPAGKEKEATVPLFNVWTIWWNTDRAAHGFAGYWDAPIFHPAANTLAFSEVQPLSVVVAPVVWITGSRVLAYNLWLWLSLVLNGVFAERLLRAFGTSPWAAIGGGAAMVLLPAAHWQLGVEQLVAVWGVLWTWEAVLRATRRPTLVRGAIAGLAFSVAHLLCGHHGLFLSVLLLAGAVWCPGTRLFSRRAIACWAVAGGVVLAVAGPFVWKHASVFRGDESFERSEERVRALSVELRDYVDGRWPQLVELPLSDDFRRWDLNPGTLKLVLALVGLAFGLWRRRWRRGTLWLATMILVALTLSLGVNLDVWGWKPWSTLVAWYPGFAQVRSAFRFAFFVQMAVLVLAAIGAHGLLLGVRRCVPRGWWRVILHAWVSLFGLVAIGEMPPAATRIETVPSVARHRAWIEFVQRETPRGRAVLCVPMAPGRDVDDFEVTTWWMYLGTFHGRPLVNGYSGFFPETYNEMQRLANAGFPDEASVRFADGLGAGLIVVDRTHVPQDRFAFQWYDGLALRHVLADDEALMDVYRIERTKRE